MENIKNFKPITTGYNAGLTFKKFLFQRSNLIMLLTSISFNILVFILYIQGDFETDISYILVQLFLMSILAVIIFMIIKHWYKLKKYAAYGLY